MNNVCIEQKNCWLVENVLGECAHDYDFDRSTETFDWECNKCGVINPTTLDFFTSDPDQQAINFFRLWKTVKEKEWFEGFARYNLIGFGYGVGLLNLIDCSALANAIGEYWKWKEIK